MSRTIRIPRRRFAWQLAAFTVAVGLAGYFGYHTLWGRYGLETRRELLSRSTVLEFEAATLNSARKALQRDIGLLNSDPPDADIIGELARDHLGYADPSDRIVRTR